MSRDALTIDQSPPLRVTTNFRAASEAEWKEADDPRSVGTADMSFWDVLDIVNPLQHIPVVGSLYRAITGDTLGAPARAMGGLLYGGPIGLMAGVVSAAVEQETGKDPGAQLLAMVGGPQESTPPPQVAAVPDGAKTDVARAADPVPVSAQTPAQTPAEEHVPTLRERMEQPRFHRSPGPDTGHPGTRQTTLPPDTPTRMPPHMVAEMMKRNYQKYEAMSRTPPAGQPIAGQKVRIDG